jgi:dTDP-4-amino-4,6-dideoxygalactose transaminase
MPMKKVAVVQSNYIPWKGYFDLVNSVDEFILYDDMQFTRRDAGRQLGRASGPLSVTDWAADRLVRLPLWIGLETQQDYVIHRCRNALGG